MKSIMTPSIKIREHYFQAIQLQLDHLRRETTLRADALVAQHGELQYIMDDALERMRTLRDRLLALPRLRVGSSLTQIPMDQLDPARLFSAIPTGTQEDSSYSYPLCPPHPHFSMKHLRSRYGYTSDHVHGLSYSNPHLQLILYALVIALDHLKMNARYDFLEARCLESTRWWENALRLVQGLEREMEGEGDDEDDNEDEDDDDDEEPEEDCEQSEASDDCEEFEDGECGMAFD